MSTLVCEAITTYGSRGQQSTLSPGPAPTAGGQLSIHSLGLQAPLLSCTAHLQLGVTSQAGAETSFRQSRLPGQLSCSPKRASPRPRQNCLLSETSSPASQHCSAICPMGQPLLEASPTSLRATAPTSLGPAGSEGGGPLSGAPFYSVITSRAISQVLPQVVARVPPCPWWLLWKEPHLFCQGCLRSVVGSCGLPRTSCYLVVLLMTHTLTPAPLCLGPHCLSTSDTCAVSIQRVCLMKSLLCLRSLPPRAFSELQGLIA